MSSPTGRLEVVAGKAVGMSILVEDELLIGRHAEGAGRLGEDEEMSRSHARVSVDSSGSFAIEDLGSTNGTFVNGLRISTPQTLREGDTIEIGGTALVVREVPSPVAAQPDPSAVQQPTIVPGVPPSPPAVPTPAPPGPPTEEAREAPPATPPPPAFEAPPATPPPPAFEAPPVPTPAPPGPPTEEARKAPPSPLSLKLEVDFDVQEARLFLDGESEPLRFLLESGRWRAAPSGPAEEQGA
jgi:pSer/pThr/pTyr-binding forkhead associated (FHA) protein